MNWLQIGVSLVAILLLAGVARALRLGESRIDTPEAAARMAEDMLAGFVARHALVSSDGRAALVAGNGTFALLKRHGAKVAARRLISPLRLHTAVEGVTVESGERMFGAVALLGVLREDVERLEAPLTLV